MLGTVHLIRVKLIGVACFPAVSLLPTSKIRVPDFYDDYVVFVPSMVCTAAIGKRLSVNSIHLDTSPVSASSF